MHHPHPLWGGDGAGGAGGEEAVGVREEEGWCFDGLVGEAG